MVQGVLIGILGNAAFHIIKNLIKKVLDDIHEQDPIINKTYQALERTCKRFFENYGETFWHNEKKRKRFFNHLLTLFDLSRVTDRELHVLTNLSVLPPIYMDKPGTSAGDNTGAFLNFSQHTHLHPAA